MWIRVLVSVGYARGACPFCEVLCAYRTDPHPASKIDQMFEVCSCP